VCFSIRRNRWRTVFGWQIRTSAAPRTDACAATTRAAVGTSIELNRQITNLQAEMPTHFEAHPDADIRI